MENTYSQINEKLSSNFNLSRDQVDEELKDAEKMTLEMDSVSDMLTRLASDDTEVSKAAQEEIDKYLLQKEHQKEQNLLQKETIEGCKIKAEKTSINTKESVKDRCKKLSEEYKLQVFLHNIHSPVQIILFLL